jgi:peptidoglycan/xylan/chitin deacetylase (PgdA/CDA1 family)
MRIPGLKTIRKSAVKFKKRIINGAVILGYHRIAVPTNNPYNVCVAPHHFTEQLEVLQKVANVIELNELVECIKTGEIPKRAVVLTFDDGYLDNLIEGLPKLDQFQMPATLYLTTYSLGQELWWDKLARLVYNAVTIPDAVTLSCDSGLFKWKMPGKANKTRDDKSDNTRKNLVLALYKFSLIHSPEMREQLIDPLEELVGIKANGIPSTRLLSEDEVQQIAGSELVEIGAHSVNHPLLANLPESDQQYEIEHSKDCLERLLNRKVDSFSYPNGSVSPKTISLVEKAGYTSACGSNNDLVWHRSQLFHLPRLWVPDVNGEDFLYWLKHWLI